jgi:hypothetical protein
MPDPASLAGGFDLPFQEQIEFFRRKLNLPTARWDDIWQAAHDRAFVVAGAAKADLLADLNLAVLLATDRGTTLETFRDSFRQIVFNRGWHGWTGEGTAAGEAWRTKVIYETNLRSSYAAGRAAQLADPGLQKLMPFRRYVHNDSVLNPRPLHLAWNGLTLPHDHPFWQTHSPPNGWGCRCRVTAVAAPRKGDPAAPPAGWDEPGEDGRLPGIDRGWGYAPGASVADDLRALVKEKAGKLPGPLAAVFRAEMAAALADPVPFATVDNVKTAFEIAMEGGRHHGLYQKNLEKRIPEIEKSIRSLQKQIAAHEEKIATPADYLPPDMPDEHIAYYVNDYWPKEIRVFKEEIEVLSGILSEVKK